MPIDSIVEPLESAESSQEFDPALGRVLPASDESTSLAYPCARTRLV